MFLQEDNDNDGGENDDDDEDGFFVPHGYLSDGEGALEEEVRSIALHSVCMSLFTVLFQWTGLTND